LKVNVTLSVDIDVKESLAEMKKKGIVPSHFVCKAVKAFAENGYELPVTIGKPESAI
jgi:hypothetical protein